MSSGSGAETWCFHPLPVRRTGPGRSDSRRLGDRARLQVGDQADVEGLVNEVVLAAGQVPHVVVVALFTGRRDGLVLVLFQAGRPDAEGLDVVVAQRQRLGHHEAGLFTVLDHHEGVREVVEAIPNHVYDPNRSGASIAWAYFHPETPLPLLLAHVEDDDLFRYRLPDTRAVITYISARPFTFEEWDGFVLALDSEDGREKMLTVARSYAEYFVLLADIAVDSAKLVEFEGHQVYFANSHPLKPMKSLVGNLLAKKRGPFALVVSAHPQGYGVSIRGDGTVDVAALAAKYGGNGHPSSAGFAIPADKPLPWTLIEEDETTGN